MIPRSRPLSPGGTRNTARTATTGTPETAPAPKTTTERGLGYPHQADKRRLLRELRPGQPCPRCGQPMWPHQKLDRDHVTDRCRGGADGPAVLSHATCNRSAGAALATPMRLATLRALAQRTITTPSRDW